MMFIDPATGWFEITEILGKTSIQMSQMLNNMWLSRYPLPEIIIFDNGMEFKKDFHHIFDDYGITPRPTMIKNHQANSILEHVHQVLGNMLRCQNIKHLELDSHDPWTELLSRVPVKNHLVT